MQAEDAQKIDEALSPTSISGAVKNEAGAAVRAEIEAGMDLARRRWLNKREHQSHDIARRRKSLTEIRPMYNSVGVNIVLLSQ